MLWTEPASQGNSFVREKTSRVSSDQIVHSSIRRFVVIRTDQGQRFFTCVRVMTYTTAAIISALGASRYNDHEIIYSEGIERWMNKVPELSSCNSKSICGGSVSVIGFVGSMTCLYHERKGDTFRDYFVLGGIALGILIGLIAGMELQHWMLSIIPWTMLWSMLLGITAHRLFRPHESDGNELTCPEWETARDG